ncbi:er membrane protein complex subunit [Fusarium austroafricanum]|uniref:Er membrane protein complex subunit n=1 Tax=Fusarium austroafricanum TaxID=2364996 RepID=A0A8H4KEY0_9HYPO|nr:er membrane protein complex subunit [Fusarium austroafricanum]
MRFTFESSALFGLLSLPAALADSLTLYLPAKPNPFSIPANTHATLSSSGVLFSAPLSAANTFVFHNVTPGSYLADVHCPTDAFHPLRIDVQLEDGEGIVRAWETYRGNDWANKGEVVQVKEGSKGRGFELRATGGKNYFMERPQFSVFAILKNPMILMALVSLVLMVGMPKLMDSMDPEMRAEFEEQRKNSAIGAAMSGQASGDNPLTNFDMAAYLAGSKPKESSSASGNGGNGGSAKNQGVRR